MKKLVIAIVAAMPLFLCGCPGDNCVDEHDPKGYVVKMKNDYTNRVIVTMFVNSSNDTSYCCASLRNHTIKITGDYYKLNSALYYDVAYTSIMAEDWNDFFSDSLSKYIADTDPFEEV